MPKFQVDAIIRYIVIQENSITKEIEADSQQEAEDLVRDKITEEYWDAEEFEFLDVNSEELEEE